MNDAQFKEKNVYIVGGSEGIGLETAKTFGRLGANVFLFSRTKEKLLKAIEQLESQRISENQRFGFMPLDVTDHLMVEAVFSQAVKEFGDVDILMNSAGKASPDYFENISFALFDEIIKVNLYSIRNAVAALLPSLKKQKGTIINISSLGGLAGIFGYTHYSAAKFGVIGFSEALKSELKWNGIKVIVLCPPDTDTPGYLDEDKTKPAETRAISASASIRNPAYVADALIKGIVKNRFLIIPGIDSRILAMVKRLFPWLLEYILDQSIKKARRA